MESSARFRPTARSWSTTRIWAGNGGSSGPCLPKGDDAFPLTMGIRRTTRWSPDGDRIAFISNETGDIAVVGIGSAANGQVNGPAHLQAHDGQATCEW
jgi:hypothetical protein